MTIRTRYFVDPSTNEPLSVSPRDLEPLAKDLQLPPYLTSTLHAHLMHSTPSVSKLAWSSFDAGWRALCSEYGSDDPVALTFGILYRAGVATSGEKAHAALAVQKQFLIGSDFVGVVKEIMERHPGYDFLAGSPTFKDRYVDTVIARLFFEKPMNAVERMTMDEFRRCDVAGMLRKVESLESCLSIDMPGPFSYKDFYVIYCKFWELDRNRDMMLTVADLKAYESQALTVPAVARIMRGHGQLVSVGRPGKANPALDKMRSDGQMNFSQFVRFILATEDKSTAHALRFWFDVLDLDSDAVLTPHELLQFWEPQSRKLDTLLRSFLRAPSPPIRPANVSPRLTPSGLPGALAMPDTYFSRDDVVCVVLDLVKPGEDGSVVLRMSDWVRDRVASAMVVDLLVDARRHLERVRKGTDGRFRRRDEVWGVGGQGNRVKLEVCYSGDGTSIANGRIENLQGMRLRSRQQAGEEV
ncbi:hypothetical protein BJ742DRAFT_743198 [Cladochytrium replicatum]|nr:hypothetical protein BJ742DRAFT_743198 [Cladochytrium replicatum]